MPSSSFLGSPKRQRLRVLPLSNGHFFAVVVILFNKQRLTLEIKLHKIKGKFW